MNPQIIWESDDKHTRIVHYAHAVEGTEHLLVEQLVRHDAMGNEVWLDISHVEGQLAALKAALLERIHR